MTETPNPNIVDTDSLTGEMHPIRRVVLSLGSNLGERLASLQGAVDALADTPDFFVTGVSPVYETDPVDTPGGLRPVPQRGAPRRHHAARRPVSWSARWPSRTPSSASAATCRNAPRTLDVDLIVVGDRRSNEDFLRLPHPRAHERAFVLQPWHDLEPDAVFPDRGPIAELLVRDRLDGRPEARGHRARRQLSAG